MNKTKTLLRFEVWYLPKRPVLSLRRFFKTIFYTSKRTLHLDRSFYPPKASNEKIDIFIPAIDKDAATLPLCINSLKQYSVNPISNIYIVAPANSRTLKQLAHKHGCRFVEEESVISIRKKDINYVHNGENRGGWIFKMLLNLSADNICKEENFLIVDADIIFIRPQIFYYSGKPIFNESPYYHYPYYAANERLLSLSHSSSLSFITHYMLFNGGVLKELRRDIELANGKAWEKAIIDVIDMREGSGFADYEIYGDYYCSRSKLPFIKNYWLVYDQQIDKLSKIASMANGLKSRFGAIGLHNYKRG